MDTREPVLTSARTLGMVQANPCCMSVNETWRRREEMDKNWGDQVNIRLGQLHLLPIYKIYIYDNLGI